MKIILNHPSFATSPSPVVKPGVFCVKLSRKCCQEDTSRPDLNGGTVVGHLEEKIAAWCLWEITMRHTAYASRLDIAVKKMVNDQRSKSITRIVCLWQEHSIGGMSSEQPKRNK